MNRRPMYSGPGRREVHWTRRDGTLRDVFSHVTGKLVRVQALMPDGTWQTFGGEGCLIPEGSLALDERFRPKPVTGGLADWIKRYS